MFRASTAPGADITSPQTLASQAHGGHTNIKPPRPRIHESRDPDIRAIHEGLGSQWPQYAHRADMAQNLNPSRTVEPCRTTTMPLRTMMPSSGRSASCKQPPRSWAVQVTGSTGSTGSTVQLFNWLNWFHVPAAPTVSGPDAAHARQFAYASLPRSEVLAFNLHCVSVPRSEALASKSDSDDGKLHSEEPANSTFTRITIHQTFSWTVLIRTLASDQWIYGTGRVGRTSKFVRVKYPI